jgi:aminoglycoside phosphotransferase (APT) family kinase protein
MFPRINPSPRGTSSPDHRRMTQVLLPEVPYDRTSVRPAWEQLPSALREQLGDVVRVRPTATGFTSGFAAVLEFVDGSRQFVKAIDLANPLSSGYLAEARFAAALPRVLPAPALLRAEELAGHIVLRFAAIAGARTPALPWDQAELDAALEALAGTAGILGAPSPDLLAVGPRSFQDTLDHYLSFWRLSQARHERADELAELEARFDRATRDCPELIHCDLRLDNVIIDSDGKAWLCDWSSLSTGPAWFDLLSLLVTAEASGLDADEVFFAHPTTGGLPEEALDWGLAAFAGYYAYAGAQQEVPTSPNLREHQRYYGRLTLRWLSRRRGWA